MKRVFFDYEVTEGVFDGFSKVAFESGNKDVKVYEVLDQAYDTCVDLGIDPWVIESEFRFLISGQSDVWDPTPQAIGSWLFGFIAACSKCQVKAEVIDKWLTEGNTPIVEEFASKYSKLVADLTTPGNFELIHMSKGSAKDDLEAYDEAIEQRWCGKTIEKDSELYEELSYLFGDDVDDIIDDIFSVPGKRFWFSEDED